MFYLEKYVVVLGVCVGCVWVVCICCKLVWVMQVRGMCVGCVYVCVDCVCLCLYAHVGYV